MHSSSFTICYLKFVMICTGFKDCIQQCGMYNELTIDIRNNNTQNTDYNRQPTFIVGYVKRSELLFSP